jgi:acyl carrier protein
MTHTSTTTITDVVLLALGRIAPEADLAALNPTADIREQLDIDSVDFLNFVLAIHKELGIDIPEADYGKLRSLESCIAYLGMRQVAR